MFLPGNKTGIKNHALEKHPSLFIGNNCYEERKFYNIDTGVGFLSSTWRRLLWKQNGVT